MRILSTLAVKKVLDELGPKFPLPKGQTLDISIDPTVLVLRRVRSGERGDLAILTTAGIDELSDAGILSAKGRLDLCVSEIGIAVKRGAAKPDISSAEAVRKLLLDVPSLAYSQAGASGIFFAGLIERLGIADEVNRKATVIPAGFTGALAADGKVAIAIQQVSELMAVPGVDIVGPLPDDVNERLTFPGAVFADAANPTLAADFIAFLKRPEFADVYRRAGLKPLAFSA
jgi:molybdate transport system substrate-binding protein